MTRYRVRIRRGDLDVVGVARAESAKEAFLKVARRYRVWPHGAGAWMEHHPGGHTYWVYPTWPVRGGTSLGDRYVAHIEEA